MSVMLQDLLNVYETECVLTSGKRFNIKPITTGQLKSLLVYENEKNPVIIEDALDRLISSAVSTDGFDVDALTLQDRMDLMLELRNVTKGPVYSFTHTCDKCGNESLVSKNLKELTVTPCKELSTTLEISNRLSFDINFPTRGDQKKSYIYNGMYESDVDVDSLKMIDVATATLAYAIRNVIIDGKVSPDFEGDNGIDQKIHILDTLPRDKYIELTEFFKDNNYGISFDFFFNCIHCGKKFEMVLPLNDFFV